MGWGSRSLKRSCRTDSGSRATWAGAVRRKELDAIIACVIAWTETPVIVGLLREPPAPAHLALGQKGGYTVDGRLVSPAAQAGTAAARDTLVSLGARFLYLYDYPDSPMCLGQAAGILHRCQYCPHPSPRPDGHDGVRRHGPVLPDVRWPGPAHQTWHRGRVLRHAGDRARLWRPTPDRVNRTVGEWKREWAFEQPVPDAMLERVARLTLALGDKIDDRGYLAMSTKCVYGVTKYMGCTACMAQSMLGDRTHFVCENDVPGMITQTMLGLLSGQSSTFMEIYEYFPDRILAGVCGFVPTSFIEDGKVRVAGTRGAGLLRQAS